ncbi:MAG TPA: glycosyltransferase [Actinocrinis sp.]|uniref:glycosyltransferase n=1 Tax=Actinocrinis sp. TaxID=1920516 RepID=UPI002D5B8AEE|nr:glycosyltransferase [Actinocrinis sp.]HZU56561.1 glycosyltransferase [Actinocrinis sp.]
MRIALVSEHANPMAALGGADAGGQNVHVACLATGMAALGHEVTVYTRRDAADTAARTQMGRRVVVEQIDAGPPRPVPKDDLLPHMPAFARELAARWKTQRPDVVHAHFWMSGLASLEAAEPLGIPVVQTYHALGVVKQRYQGSADTSPPSRIETEREIGKTCARIVATCSDELFELVRLGVDRRHISVIPCGVDLERFTPQGPVAPRGRRHRLLAIGRLVPRKGFDMAIRALAQLPEAELVIAGGPPAEQLCDEPEAHRLRQIAAECDVADRVKLLGAVPRGDMPALLRSAELVLCTPWYEPFGIVPLEAMASGIPVVASAVGGLTDTVLDGVTGVLVPPRAPDALADALKPLIKDRELRRQLGLNGLLRARSRYGWPRIARRTAEVYSRLVAEGTGRIEEAVNR